MTIPASSAPAVRAYLRDQLTTALTPDPNDKSSSLLVCFDTPGTYQPDDIVAVGRVNRQISINSIVGGGGAGWLEERYTVAVTVDVFRGNDDAQAAYVRAVSLVDGICAVVRTDPSLGGLVLTANPSADLTEVAWDEQHEGMHATSTLEVSCYQRV